MKRAKRNKRMKISGPHPLRSDEYPLTIRHINRHGALIWSHTVETPPDGELRALWIPGWVGTDHVPVTTEIEYANGVTDRVDADGNVTRTKKGSA